MNQHLGRETAVKKLLVDPRQKLLSNMSRITYVLVFFLTCECALGAPIAMMMGCGKGKPLSLEKQSFCCEHFNLDCPLNKAVEVDAVRMEGLESEYDEFKVHVRTLGERCKPPLYVCGVGLECKQGLCFRNKTRAHLKSLLRRGREVEEEERQQIRDGEDVDDKDPLPARKGLILEGQSLRLTDEDRRVPVKSMTDRVTSSQKKNAMDVTDLEEDEIAANIGDLLSKKMGIKLSAKQIHNVREVIAGTIDERVEREEQLDEAEGNANETETAEAEKLTTLGIDTTSSSNGNRKDSNRSTAENSLPMSESSQILEVREDCGSHSDVRKTEMQCPATRSRKTPKGEDALVDIESVMVDDKGALRV